MNQFLSQNGVSFSARKVSVDQAIRLLKRNGIRVDKEKAETILDFLYLIAKTYRTHRGRINQIELDLEDESNTI